MLQVSVSQNLSYCPNMVHGSEQSDAPLYFNFEQLLVVVHGQRKDQTVASPFVPITGCVVVTTTVSFPPT